MWHAPAFGIIPAAEPASRPPHSSGETPQRPTHVHASRYCSLRYAHGTYGVAGGEMRARIQPADENLVADELRRLSSQCSEERLRHILGRMRVVRAAPSDRVDKTDAPTHELGERRFGAFIHVAPSADRCFVCILVEERSPDPKPDTKFAPRRVAQAVRWCSLNVLSMLGAGQS